MQPTVACLVSSGRKRISRSTAVAEHKTPVFSEYREPIEQGREIDGWWELKHSCGCVAGGQVPRL